MSATLQVISSSSDANGYILTCGEDKLILEAGCKPKDYLTALNYDLNGVSGILCSHIHSDHSRSIKALQNYGLTVCAPPSVCEKHPKCKQVEHMHKYMIGNFWALPLKVPHGDCECLAYHLNLPDGQTLLFATDLSDFPYSVKGVNTLMIECNNADSIIIDRLYAGRELRGAYDTHLSLDNTIKVIKRLRSPDLNKVILIHLSAANADENLFKTRIWQECGVRVEIAEAGAVYELKEDF